MSESIERLIGRIENQISTQQTTIERHQDEIRDQLSAIGSRMDKFDGQMDEIEKWHQRLIGMRWTAYAIVGALGAGIATLSKWFWFKVGQI